MAKLLLKKSSVDGNAAGTSDIDYGELAINYRNGRLFYKDNSNNIDNFIDSDLINAKYLSKAGGTLTGNIAFAGSQTVDGRDVSTDGTKLDGIEANADVTDTTNVTAAGALMLTGGTMSGIITMGNNKIVSLATPVDSADAVPKYYVDSALDNFSGVNGTQNRYSYTATAGQTTFAANYDVGFVDVYLNGVRLVVGTDVTATSGTNVVFTSALALNDVVEIVGYGIFALADHYTKAESDLRFRINIYDASGTLLN
jgi:hypothetical protein